MPVYPAARTQGAMQAALNSLRQSSQDQNLRFSYFNAENALDLAKRQQAMEATHTLRADKAARKAAAGKKGGSWGQIAGTAIGFIAGGPPGAMVGASLGGAVDSSISGQPGQASPNIAGTIGDAMSVYTGMQRRDLDIYTEMQQFEVPKIQEYMDAQPEVFGMGLR